MVSECTPIYSAKEALSGTTKVYLLPQVWQRLRGTRSSHPNTPFARLRLGRAPMLQTTFLRVSLARCIWSGIEHLVRLWYQLPKDVLDGTAITTMATSLESMLILHTPVVWSRTSWTRPVRTFRNSQPTTVTKEILPETKILRMRTAGLVLILGFCSTVAPTIRPAPSTFTVAPCTGVSSSRIRMMAKRATPHWLGMSPFHREDTIAESNLGLVEQLCTQSVCTASSLHAQWVALRFTLYASYFAVPSTAMF